MTERKFDLEDRLIDFSVMVIDIVEGLPNTKAANYIAGQLIRCGIAPSLIYGEAQSAESREDFIHKMKIAVKELKETRICFKLIKKKSMINASRLGPAAQENEELIAIGSKSIQTAKTNRRFDK